MTTKRGKRNSAEQVVRKLRDAAGPALRFTTTFWTFLREFSPLWALNFGPGLASTNHIGSLNRYAFVRARGGDGVG